MTRNDLKKGQDAISTAQLNSDEFENSRTQHEEIKRVNGVYYTPFELSQKFFERFPDPSASTDFSFLEPCVGTGSFYFAFLNWRFQASEKKKNDLQRILNQMFACDIDAEALNHLKHSIKDFCLNAYGLDVKVPEDNFAVANLLEVSTAGIPWNPKVQFRQPEGFDFVVTNPPYFQLKRTEQQGKTTQDLIDSTLDNIRRRNDISLQTGVLNSYKVFVELILKHWVANGGHAGLLIPQGVLRDQVSTKLRSWLLENYEVNEIVEIEEKVNAFRGASQSFHMFWAKNGKATSKVQFLNAVRVDNTLDLIESEDEFLVDEANFGKPVLRMSLSESDFFRHIQKQKTLEQYVGFKNARGEIDVTNFRDFLNPDSGMRVTRGAQIKSFFPDEGNEFVDLAAIKKLSKIDYISSRIACQQISNRNQSRRMKWALIPGGTLLANSCNYISIRDGLIELEFPPDEALFTLLGILNSSVIERWFSIISANNHISNQEISILPVGELVSESANSISRYVKDAFSKLEVPNQPRLDSLVIRHFKLEGSI